MLERNAWFRTAVVVIAFSAIIFLVDTLRRVWDFLGDLLLIFFLAYLVGSLIIHTVQSLMRVPGMKRPIAVALVYAVLIGIAAVRGVLVIPSTVTQAIELANLVPVYLERLPDLVDRVEAYLAGFNINIDLATLIQYDSLTNWGGALGGIVQDNALNIARNVVSIVFSASLVIVISFYVVLDGGRRLNEALKVLPQRAERETRFVLSTIDETFRGYLRGMVVVSLIYGVGTAGVMLATGLPAALPVAFVSSILLAVPFIGDWLALALPLIVAAVSGDFITLLTVLLTLLFVQQVMLNLLTPRILGRAVRMPAMLVVIAVVLGARLAGIAGALLGVPTMGVVYALAVHYGMVIRKRREAKEQARVRQSRSASAARRRAAAQEEAPAPAPAEPPPNPSLPAGGGLAPAGAAPEPGEQPPAAAD